MRQEFAFRVVAAETQAGLGQVVGAEAKELRAGGQFVRQ